jgi:hypothetical protein
MGKVKKKLPMGKAKVEGLGDSTVTSEKKEKWHAADLSEWFRFRNSNFL